jgi:hypothetical protein
MFKPKSIAWTARSCPITVSSGLTSDVFLNLKIFGSQISLKSDTFSSNFFAMFSPVRLFRRRRIEPVQKKKV